MRERKKKGVNVVISILSLPPVSTLTGVRLQLASDVAVSDIDRVEEGAYPVVVLLSREEER